MGESGKSVRELEKTIALLKKVAERTQEENERLKKAPGVVAGGELQQLRMDNEQLHVQLEEARSQMGAKLTERYSIKEQGYYLYISFAICNSLPSTSLC